MHVPRYIIFRVHKPQHLRGTNEELEDMLIPVQENDPAALTAPGQYLIYEGAGKPDELGVFPSYKLSPDVEVIEPPPVVQTENKRKKAKALKGVA